MNNKIATLIRIDEKTYEDIKEIAINENRSINGQINYIIEKYVREYFEREKSENEQKKDL